MRLTRVEIHGFKSFADRTTLELPPGLTAIVGPNGCGKSNVIDAIKWALGEQRASALRGKDMLDVIFKGNGARAQRNFAEVSLVFDNSDGILPIEYTEVVLTRRLFRSGESEYLLNRQPARLKDIRDLLMDTGLGASAYSVMEQGRIDAVLSANPFERRRIFEEAAGISRYRARRRESESKLARTEQNLLRLGDVVEELEKRQRSLKVQAGRARSFVEARDRSSELRSLYYTHQWHERGAELERQELQLGDLTQAEQKARSELEETRHSVSAMQERLTLVRQEVDEMAESFRKATGEVEALGERQSALHERVDEIADRRKLLEGRVAGLQLVLAERREELESVGQRLDEVTAEATRWQAEVTQRTAAHGEADQALESWRQATEERREAALGRVGTLTEYRNRRSAAASRHAGLKASHDRLAEHIVDLDGQIAEQTEQQGELFGIARNLDSDVESKGTELSGRLDQEQRLGSDLQTLDGQLQDLRESMAASASRREALNELIQRRDGVSPGAVCLLESDLDGLHGLLVDHLEVPRGLAEAVEVALGDTTQAIVVAGQEQGLAALAHLAKVEGGRVSLIPADSLRPQEGAAAGERLLDQLQVTAHSAVFESLLSHVRLVPDRAALSSVQADGVTVWVTPEGELLDERGILRGGAAGQAGGLVARRAELAELIERCETLESDLQSLSVRRGSAQEQLLEVRETVAQARRSLRELEAERERALEAERQGAARQQSYQRDRSLRETELASIASELAEVATVLDEATRLEHELETAVAADRQEEAREELRHREIQTTFVAAQDTLAAARVELASRRERQDALESERRQVQRSADERGEDAEAAQSEFDGLVGLRSGLEQKLADISDRATELTEQRDVRAGALNTARDQSTDVGQHLEAGQLQVTDHEGVLERCAQVLSEHRLESRETAIRRDELHQRVLEELSIDLAQSEQPGQQDEPTDWDGISAEIDKLREKLGRMGNVNLEAVDELRDVEQRLGFMVTQRDDLVAATQSLNETINKLNRESRERFVVAFAEVREHFRTIFRKLFRGGKADIALAEGEDVLEAGIEITAAPPGKDARNITLLSGGERTLTAVGLLFALFRSRPSPVCLLDEVDAALDETNIDRFCSVLEDFLGESQFLVVTHARRTMSYADQVFGVTMQEHGVSKVLSLTIDEYERHGASGNGSAQEAVGGSNGDATGKPSSAPVVRDEVRKAMEAGEAGA
jgi:chromosome segregation protein